MKQADLGVDELLAKLTNAANNRDSHVNLAERLGKPRRGASSTRLLPPAFTWWPISKFFLNSRVGHATRNISLLGQVIQFRSILQISIKGCYPANANLKRTKAATTYPRTYPRCQ